MKNRLKNIGIVLIIIIMATMNICILYLMVDLKLNLNNDINKTVKQSITNLNIPKSIDATIDNKVRLLNINNTIDTSIQNKIDSLNLHNGYTPILGVDYFNGVNGKDGSNGKDGNNGLAGVSIKGDTGEPGKNAPIGVPVCNTKKNRWEITYDSGISYEVITSKDKLSTVKCTI